MEPDTGKILAMVSKPGYDPNTLAQDWEVLNADEGGQSPLLNRAAQGLYPPGSTFKIVTALEYMREHPLDYKDYRFDCSGTYVNGDYTIRCYHGESHGSQDFVQAFANSCNGAFASLGLELNLASLKGTAEELLFNRELPLTGFPYKESSFVMEPGAGTWEILQTSMGQGKTEMTPLHNALLTAAIANGGTLMKPYLLDRVVSAGEEEVKKFMPEAWGSLMTAQEAANLTELMEAVVTVGTPPPCARTPIRQPRRQAPQSLKRGGRPMPGSQALPRRRIRSWWSPCWWRRPEPGDGRRLPSPGSFSIYI